MLHILSTRFYACEPWPIHLEHVNVVYVWRYMHPNTARRGKFDKFKRTSYLTTRLRDHSFVSCSYMRWLQPVIRCKRYQRVSTDEKCLKCSPSLFPLNPLFLLYTHLMGASIKPKNRAKVALNFNYYLRLLISLIKIKNYSIKHLVKLSFIIQEISKTFCTSFLRIWITAT